MFRVTSQIASKSHSFGRLGTSRQYVSLQDLVFGESSKEPSDKLYKAALAANSEPLPVATKKNGRFISPWSHKTEKKSWDVLKFLLTRQEHKLRSQEVSDTKTLIKPAKVNREKMRGGAKPHFTWLGHATCCYQTDGVFFLTDPVWAERASPSRFFGPKRYIDPPLEIEDLKIDVVLLSHTHYDHLDENAAKRIGNKALWIVPLGVKEVLASLGVTNCVELDWWQTHNYTAPSTGANIEIVFTPAKHWTARSITDRNTCLWGSFAVLGKESRFFFTGDTAYCSVFKQIGAAFGPFDIAAIPIGAYLPRWFMRDVHCNPSEAVLIHQDLQARQSVAIHWGTFPMADEDAAEPALELARARDVRHVTTQDFFTMKHGETLTVGETPDLDFASNNSAIYGVYLDSLREREDGLHPA